MSLEGGSLEDHQLDDDHLQEPLRQPFLGRVLRCVNSESFVIYFYIALTNAPQIVAAVVILTLDWNTSPSADCRHSYEERWKTWAVLCALRSLSSSYVALQRHYFLHHLDYNEETSRVRFLTNVGNTLDLMDIILFVIGNIWLFRLSQYVECGKHGSVVYWLCVGMLGLQYLEIGVPSLLTLMPFVAAIMMLPVFVFCGSRYDQFIASRRGAEIIDQIPIVTYHEPPTEDKGASVDEGEHCCPICLGDFVEGDQLRLLPCKHQFHQTCVDPWLTVNATCPNCRYSVMPEGEEGSDDDADEEDNLTVV